MLIEGTRLSEESIYPWFSSRTKGRAFRQTCGVQQQLLVTDLMQHEGSRGLESACMLEPWLNSLQFAKQEEGSESRPRSRRRRRKAVTASPLSPSAPGLLLADEF
jgi:hypothetical protein